MEGLLFPTRSYDGLRLYTGQPLGNISSVACNFSIRCSSVIEWEVSSGTILMF